MSVDHENNTVTCDINDSKDMQLTADFLANNEGFSVIGQDNNKGSSWSFSNADEFNEYRANSFTNGVSIAFNITENFFESGIFGIGMDASSSFFGMLGNRAGSLSTGLIGAAVGVGLTVEKFMDNDPGATMQAIDTIGGGLGFVNPIIPLTYHLYKPVVMKLANDGAQFNCSFKKDPWGSFHSLMETVSGSSSVWFGR